MSYQIKSWNGVITEKSLPLASVSIIPDTSLLEIMSRNKNNLIQIKIQGTESGYDRVWISSFDKSANIPNCRPNFFEEYQEYVFTLIGSSWQGEPANNGNLSIVNGPYTVYSTKPMIDQDEKKDEKKDEEKDEEINTELPLSSGKKEIQTSPVQTRIQTPLLSKKEEVKNSKHNILIYSVIALIILSLILILLYLFNSSQPKKVYKFMF